MPDPQSLDYAFNTRVVSHADLYENARIKADFDFLIEKLAEDAPAFSGNKPAPLPVQSGKT